MPIRCWDCRNRFRGLFTLPVRSRTPTEHAVRFEPELLPPCTSPVRRCSCVFRKSSKSSPGTVLSACSPMSQIRSLVSHRRVRHVCSCLSNIPVPFEMRNWQPSSPRVKLYSRSVSLGASARLRSRCTFASMSTFTLRS
jgi:hypothetical protein